MQLYFRVVDMAVHLDIKFYHNIRKRLIRVEEKIRQRQRQKLTKHRQKELQKIRN